MYACGGVRPIDTGIATFPIGSVEDGETCPAREICAWYAEYDFGGTTEYNDQPECSMLQPAFKTGPFSCDRYFDHAELLNNKRRVLRSRKAIASLPVFRVLPDLEKTEEVSLVELARQR
jgi:hypothetical protein